MEMMMTSASGRPQTLSEWVQHNAVIMTFVATNTLALFSWGIRTEMINHDQNSEIKVLRVVQAKRGEDIARIDERGSRALPNVELRLNQHEVEFNKLRGLVEEARKAIENLPLRSGKVPPVIQNQIDSLKEQQLRIIQALDNVYNLLNEHMRRDNDRPDIRNPKLNLIPPVDPRKKRVDNVLH